MSRAQSASRYFCARCRVWLPRECNGVHVREMLVDTHLSVKYQHLADANQPVHVERVVCSGPVYPDYDDRMKLVAQP